MKRTLKYALLASTAVFVLGMAMPSQAQQGYMQPGRATSPQWVYQPEGLGYNAYAYAPEGLGYGAYAYVPLDPGFGGGGCATLGGYGKGLDYSFCGGGGGD